MSTENLLPPTCPWCLPWSLDTGRRTEGSLDISPQSRRLHSLSDAGASSGQLRPVTRAEDSRQLHVAMGLSSLRSQVSSLKSQVLLSLQEKNEISFLPSRNNQILHLCIKKAMEWNEDGTVSQSGPFKYISCVLRDVCIICPNRQIVNRILASLTYTYLFV